MIPLRDFIGRYKTHILAAVVIVAGCFIFRKPFLGFYDLLTDREWIKGFVTSWGSAAPLVLILVQILQVVFAPVPGEISGFVGGYLFGATQGFIYSSIGLAVGSAINFFIGRLLGKGFVHRLIPESQWERLDRFIKHQGVLVLFILFAFPGFPKDYLCLFLGLTRLPFKVFILLAAVGRMPGTLMLSIEGSLLYKQMYGLYAIVFGLCLVLVFIAWRYRMQVYKWIERLNGK